MILSSLSLFFKRIRPKLAFTMIEVLIVIAVAGILASAEFVAIDPAKRMTQSRDTQRKRDLNLITVGLEAYYNNLSSTTATFYRKLASQGQAFRQN